MKPCCTGSAGGAHHFVLQRERPCRQMPVVHAVCRTCRLLWSFGDSPPTGVRYASPTEAARFLAANCATARCARARTVGATQEAAHAG